VGRGGERFGVGVSLSCGVVIFVLLLLVVMLIFFFIVGSCIVAISFAATHGSNLICLDT